MSKVIVKQKKSKDVLLNDISNMYKEVFESPKLDETIITGKVNNLLELLNNFKEVVNEFNVFLINNQIFIDLNIRHFLDMLTSLINVKIDNVIEKYKYITESPIYSQIIRSCVLIKNIYENIEGIKKDDDQFIKLFEFSDFSIKSIFSLDDKVLENNFLIILKKMYNVVFKISEEIFKPDIDIKKLSEFIKLSITTLRTKVSRCDRAFNIIENSVDLLDNNFKDYFREAKINGNDSGIIFYFLNDLSKSENIKKYRSSATLTRQFRTIMKYLYDANQQVFKNRPQIDTIVKTTLKSLEEFAM